MTITTNRNLDSLSEAAQSRAITNEQTRKPEQRFIDLALSGGGFRATLFHLGVIGFLRSQGLLSQVRTISSVSGGSILAAHMITRWKEYTDPDDKVFERAVEHLITVIQQYDVTGRALWKWRSIYRLLTRRALDSEVLVDEYRRILGPTDRSAPEASQVNHPTRWEDLRRLKLPVDLYLLATHIRTATMCVFSKEKFSISPPSDKDDSDPEIAGLREFARRVRIGVEDIARGVAASSAFPPVFAPLPVTKKDDARLHPLTDGGVYDNSGVRYLRQLYEKKGWTSDHNRLVIVSDAGRAFSFELGGQFDSIVELATRVSDAQGNRIAEFDSDVTEKFFKEHEVPVLRCSIHERIEEDWLPENHTEIVQHRVREIRTELDKFSDLEVFVLYRHGFLTAKKQFLREFGDNATQAILDDNSIWLPHKKNYSNAVRETLEKELESSHVTKKFALVRKWGVTFLTLASIFVLFLAAMTGFLFSRNSGVAISKPVDVPTPRPAYYTGTAYNVAHVDKLELQFAEATGNSIWDGKDHWPIAYGSGLVFDREVDGKYVFYMITDRGPAFDGPKTSNGEALKLYMERKYVPRIAKVELPKQRGSNPTVVNKLELWMNDEPVEGVPPAGKSAKEVSAEFDHVTSFKVLRSERFGIDPEDLALGPDGAFWICEEYRPAIMKATTTRSGIVDIQKKILVPGDGLPKEFEHARPNRGIESISIKNNLLFVALQGAFDEDARKDGHILIARSKLREVDGFVNGGPPPNWDVFKYEIPHYYKTEVKPECSIGGIHAIDDNRLLVLEREVNNASRHHVINLINLEGVAPNDVVVPVEVLDLSRIQWISEKPEGISVIGDRSIVISADNDFGMLLEGVIEVKLQPRPGESEKTPIEVPITNKLFETVVNAKGEYEITCKLLAGSPSITLQPRDRENKKGTTFWVIHLSEPLVKSPNTTPS